MKKKWRPDFIRDKRSRTIFFVTGFLILHTGMVLAVVSMEEKNGTAWQDPERLLTGTIQYTQVRRKYPLSAVSEAIPVTSGCETILIKFDKKTSEELDHQSMKSRPGQARLRLPARYEAWAQKYRVSDIQRILKGSAGDGAAKICDLLKNPPKKPTRKEQKILSRFKRLRGSPVCPDEIALYRMSLEIQEGQSLERAIQEISSLEGVEYAQINHTYKLHARGNDPLYPLQWALENTGQIYPPGYAGTVDSDIDAEAAWDIQTGNPSLIVAVIDTGVDSEHRDLRENLWINEGEIPSNEIDDDGNGYIDDVFGYDFSDGDADPSDYLGHGTHCAGIIASQGNNGLDISGVVWDAQIMAIKMFPLATDEAAYASILYAADNGADVISCSWGPSERNPSNPVLEEAVDYAYSLGCIVVFSAGNDNDEVAYYSPANDSKTLAVSATDSRDQKASFSNWGSLIDAAAPGVDILSLRAGGTTLGAVYDDYTVAASGTSMSCPHVSGACALLLSIDDQADFEEIREILKVTGDPAAGSPAIGSRLNLGALAAVAAGQGVLTLDRELYSCSDQIQVTVIDTDARGISRVEIHVYTDSGDYEQIELTPIGQGSAVFRGQVSTSGGGIVPSDGLLQTTDGESIQVSYLDMGQNEWIFDSAMTDCRSPVVHSVDIYAPGPRVTVTVKADEPFRGRVRIGSRCGGPYLIEQEQTDYLETHVFIIRGFQPGRTYFLLAECTDSVGNTTIEDQHGSCFSFTTTTPRGQIRVPQEYPTIQEAIDHAWSGDEILAAKGVYSGPGNYDLNFYGENITIRGESGPEECILDCRAKGRGFVFIHGEDNRSVVDGFTIKNGWSQVDYDPFYAWGEELGGGIYCLNSTPTIRNCRFIENYSDNYGGGLFCEHAKGQIAVQNCQFLQNQSGWGGGAVCLGDALIEDCDFISNSSIDLFGEGGGLIATGTIYLRGCFFLHNQTVDYPKFGSAGYSYGGGAFLAYCTGRVEQCLFRENQASYGGGAAVYAGQLDIINTLSCRNRAEVSGGGIWLWDSRINILHCTVAENESHSTIRNVGGGGVTLLAGRTRIENSIIWGNYAGRSLGQEIQISGWCARYQDKRPWHCVQDKRAELFIAFSNIKPGMKSVYRNRYTDYTQGKGIYSQDPKFLFPEDYHLSGCLSIGDKNRGKNCDPGNRSSHCIDAGTDTPSILLPESDFDGGLRLVNQGPDLGVFEFDPTLPVIGLSKETLYFECTSGGPVSGGQKITILNGSSKNPMVWKIVSKAEWIRIEPDSGQWPRDQEIQFRIDPSKLDAGNYNAIVRVESPGAINDGRRILIRAHVSGEFRVPGNYPTIQSAVFAARSGETVCVEDGLYAGPGNRDIRFYGKGIHLKSRHGPRHCILDCRGTPEDPHRGFRLWEFDISEDPILEGLTIQNGYAGDDFLKQLPPLDGGGIYIYGMKPIIRNCIFLNNRAVMNGGGIFSLAGEKEEELLFPISIEECIFSDNHAAAQGGGVSLIDRVFMRNCLFYENKASMGGGIHCLGSIQSFVNCTLTRNEAVMGGGICLEDSLDGFSFIESDPSMNIINSIVWENYAIRGPEIILGQSYLNLEPPAVKVAYSDIKGGQEGIVLESAGEVSWGCGNLNANPVFTGPGVRNFHLLPGSPCIDAANGDSASPYDLEGQERYDDPEKPNQGIGLIDYVDIGALEYRPEY